MSKKVVLAAGLGVAAAAALGFLWFRVPANPTTPDDCAWVLDPGPRKDCMVDVAVHTFGTDPKAGEALLKLQLPDSVHRDMVYYLVTKEYAPNDMRYCKLIEGAAIRGQCEEVVNRPHLLDGSSTSPRRPPGGPGGPGGGPPPGGAPPPAP